MPSFYWPTQYYSSNTKYPYYICTDDPDTCALQPSGCSTMIPSGCSTMMNYNRPLTTQLILNVNIISTIKQNTQQNVKLLFSAPQCWKAWKETRK